MTQSKSVLWSASHQTPGLFLRKAKPATGGIVSTVLIAGAALCQTAPAAALCAPQYQVKITVVGKVTSGTDTAGAFGSDRNLAGKDYQLIYTIDCAQGSQAPPVGNPPYYSTITATNNSYPISADLTIGPVTQSTGFGPNSSAWRDTPPNGGGDAIFIAAAAGVGLPTIQTTVWFTNPLEIVSYDWASPLLYYPTATNTSTFGQFSISIFTKGTANGRLSVTSISVSGPVLLTK